MVFAKKVARAIGKTIPCQRVGVAVLGLMSRMHMFIWCLSTEGTI